jgi:hypothetical protein
MSKPLNMIVREFSEHGETIKNLYSTDDDFKTLCEDYYISRMNIEKLREQLLENRQSALEYKHLAVALEKEILEYLWKVEQ